MFNQLICIRVYLASFSNNKSKNVCPQDCDCRLGTTNNKYSVILVPSVSIKKLD